MIRPCDYACFDAPTSSTTLDAHDENRMDEDDEFGFDDDALDALPDVALQQLERDAFLSTQAQAQARKSVSNARPPSDYGLDDEEVVDLDAFPQDVQQFSQWPQQARFVDRSAIKFRGGGDSQVDPGQPSVDVTELQRYVFEVRRSLSFLCALELTACSSRVNGRIFSAQSKTPTQRRKLNLEKLSSSDSGLTDLPATMNKNSMRCVSYMLMLSQSKRLN